MRKFLLAAAVTLVAAPAMAQTYYGPQNGLNRGDYGPAYTPRYYDQDPDATGSIAPAYPGPAYAPPVVDEEGWGNPAAEGNAGQQDKPVKNYGNVSGGPAAAGEW